MNDEPSQNLEAMPASEPVIASVTNVTNQADSLSTDSNSQIKLEEQIINENVTYSEKTDRLKVITKLLKALTPLIWAIVIILVIIPLLGSWIISQSVTSNHSLQSSTSTVTVPALPDLSKVNVEIQGAINKSHAIAENFASKELDTWEGELNGRVDSFLDWYFDYFKQKTMEFSTPFKFIVSAVINKFDMSVASQKVAEKLTEDFQREFAKRVLVPKLAQMRLESITTETTNLYISELGNNIKGIQGSYNIPQGEWEKYLNDIAVTINDTEGTLSNFSLRVLIGGGGYIVAKPLLIGLAGKVGSKVMTKFAGKAAAKMAAKTGGTVAGQLGVGLIDPIVGVGILIWDLWDYHHTVKVERPILRQNILAYLDQVKNSLLKNPESGIMAAINQLELSILKGIQATDDKV
ncbi:hypothetical protein PN499_08040 [Kamptonema animale CS-326]|jgi:hypothetical protein|uniref:hypothetical protein n=1 Tax=Kamptonema animale TaxID=92934 RepID=UPI00232D5D7D|nr:hypothetical protein [Kamptonema animale]MDB9511129.1 hypothetical protein [Kamptonema animale CS-326]